MTPGDDRIMTVEQILWRLWLRRQGKYHSPALHMGFVIFSLYDWVYHEALKYVDLHLF